MNTLIVSLLAIVALLELSVGVLVFKNNKKRELGALHAFHLIGLGLWAIGMAFYFGLPESQAEAVVFWTRFLYFFGVTSGISFFGFAYALYNDGIGTKMRWGIGGIVTVFFISLFFTDSILSSVAFYPGNRQVIQEWLYPLFFIGLFASYLSSFYLLLRYILTNQGIARYQATLILLSAIPVVNAAFVVNMLIPVLYGNFHYAWLAPILLPTSAFTVYYAIHRYRFLGISFRIPSILREILSITLAGVVSIKLFNSLYLQTNLITAEVSAVFSFVLVYILFSQLFHRLDLFSYGPLRRYETFKKSIAELVSTRLFYTSLEELKEALEKVFVETLDISFVKLCIEDKEIPASLKTYFRHRQNILVKDELVLKSKRERVHYAFLDDLKSLGEVCVPLYKSKQADSFMGILVIGKKPHQSIYIQDELLLLEQVGRYVSLALLGIFYNTELQKEVHTKTKELKSIVAQQNDFILTASHELRTPLTSMMLIFDSLLEEVQDHDTKELIEGAQQSSQRIQKLVETLFEVQSLETGKVKLNIEKVPLKKFLDHIQAEYKSFMEEKGIALHIDTRMEADFTTHFDALRIHQVMGNLLSNAKKFTPNGGAVTISLERHPKEDAILFSVSDTGEGVPDHSKEYIFEKFRSNHVFRGEGVGLGLYICRKIVEMHKGEIWVEDNPNGGSCFYVKIPNQQI